jgi:hypothetical protein
MNKWIRGGTPPPTASRMERDFTAPPVYDPTVPSGLAPAYAKGANGLTLGGIQLAEYDYSTAINEGAGTTGPGICGLTGMHQWYTDQELAARYPDPDAYLRGAHSSLRATSPPAG